MRKTSQWLCAVAVLTIAGFAAQVHSSTDSAKNDVAGADKMAESLANHIGENKLDDFKMELWNLAVDESLTSTLAEQMSGPYKGLTEMLGARTKMELLKHETAGSNIARYTYAEFHTRGVIVWTFEFFRPNDEWKLHAYRFGPLQMENEGPLAEAGLNVGQKMDQKVEQK